MWVYKVGVVAEGKTDLILIEGILRNVLDSTFTISQISPTEDELLGGVRKYEGFGWRSVYHTCRELQDKLTVLGGAAAFDFIIIHLDGDVSHATYQSANIDTELTNLPCYDEGQSIEETCEKLRDVIKSWLDDNIDTKLVFFTPYIATDLWAGYILYEAHRNEFIEAIASKDLESMIIRIGNKQDGKLFRRRQNNSVKKITKSFSVAASTLDMILWKDMVGRFSQADFFHKELEGVKH